VPRLRAGALHFAPYDQFRNREPSHTSHESTGEKVGTMTMTADKGGAGTASPEKPADRPALAHDKRKALGRGLESLLPAGPRVVAGTALAGASTAGPSAIGKAGTIPAEVNAGTTAGAASGGDGASSGAGSGVLAALHGQAPGKAPAGQEVVELALDRIEANPYQTRHFTREIGDELKELAESIQASGVIQPITVRPTEDGRYALIAGERRTRASKIAGKTTIPAIVRKVSDQQAAEMTVIENLQRADLNCMDQARAFAMLSHSFGLTQEKIGERVGWSRESVSNYMRLVRLPDDVQEYLKKGDLEFSHARVLLNLREPEIISKVAQKAVKEHMSVDQLERFVLFDPSLLPGHTEPGRRGARWVDPNVRAAQRDLERILGVKVRIRDRKGKGKITLEYATLEDFDRVLEMLTGKKKSHE
jgi:ParB family transcriptional regulator, chromosome partitioning protein